MPPVDETLASAAAVAVPPPSATWLQRQPHRLVAALSRRHSVSVERLVLLFSLYWLVTANGRFLAAALQGRSPQDASAWGFGLALCALVGALHVLILALVCNRWTVKPVLALLAVGTALASFYMGAFGVYLDPSMLRNLLRTDVAEAAELVGLPMLAHLALLAGLPLLLLARVRVQRRPWPRALGSRLMLLLAAAGVVVAALMSVFQPFSSLMRNQRELRYLITPANYLWSSATVLAADARGAARPRRPIGEDAAPGPSWAGRQKPLVVVVVVGETARSANWGLSGAPRQTTPQLAQLPVVNFPQVTSCGTNTEVSLPCMFAPVGRRDYDEARIRGQQSLMHVAARAGVQVHWRDNQSGCKGVCDGLPQDTVAQAMPAGPGCADGHCLDEGLVADLDQRLGQARGTQLWVLHMIGSHGPSYFRRYPPAFARFQPACHQDDLRQCSAAEIAHAYDNSILYTDHVLATAIARLKSREGQVDSALVFVSDHGESLGERGLFLHGMPYAIAPKEQTQVPMVVWASAGLEAAAGLVPGCARSALQARARQPVAHDHLFHTVLGLLDVRTRLRDDGLNLLQGCEQAAAARP